jgi:hypothetical protein
MTFTMRLALSLIAVVAIGLIGCGKKASETKHTISDFDHPSPQLLQEIASKQGWKLEDVQLENRVSAQIDAHQKVSDADWKAMVKAVEQEPAAFGDQLSDVICTTYPIDERFRSDVIKWSEKSMTQEEIPGEAVVGGYFSYVLAKGPDRDVWKARLVARGGVYPEKMAEEEEIIAKWQVKLARLEREAQNGTK